MDCTDCVEQLTDYIEGLLDEKRAKEVEEHFTACSECKMFFHQFRQTLEWTHEFFEKDVELPEDMKNRLVGFLNKISEPEE